MNNYIAFNETGRVLFSFRTNSIPEIPGATIAQVAENVLDVGSVFFENGELKQKGLRPSIHHTWDWATKSWLPNLDAARESQRQAWNAWRDRELVAGYAHNGHVFHSDETFMSELHTLIKGYEQGYFTGTSEIRTKGNVVLQMSHIEIETLLLLLGQHRQAIYRQSWTGKDALPGKATLEAIMAGGPPT